MIEFKQNNTNLEYIDWVKQFNEQDYINEFIDKIRDNKIYHDIWNNIIQSDGDFEIIY